MKVLIGIFAILAFSGMAYAEDKWDAQTEADCLKAGGVWVAAEQDCQAPGDQPEEEELQQENE
jgi:hypothetical protein